MLQLLFILILLYLLVLAGMYVFQRKLIFVPGHSPAYPKEASLDDIELVRLSTPDNETLLCWYKEAQSGYPTIVYFHGNAGDLTDRTDKYRTLTDKGFGLFALSYRGYGGSTGSPSESGLMTDARTAIAYVTSRGIAASDMLLYGESLGSGVAVRMASEHQPGAVILEAPYTSVANRAQELYPFLPVKLLIRDRFDSLGVISSIQSPLLIVHGEADTVIPPAHGRALLDAAPEPKQAIFYPGVAHVDFDLLVLADAVHAFAVEHTLIAADTESR